jgi:uncharacterized protein YkwD
MKSQSLLIVASLCSLASLVSTTEAGIFGRRQSSSNNRTTYTYRPATTTAAAKPAVPAAKPASEASSTEASDKVEAKTVSVSKPETPTFHPTILSMLARNNSTRTTRGLRPMSLSARLTAAAQNHANYMARTGSFSHYTNGSPQGRVAAHGFRGGVRENIAMGQPSVEGAFNTWTASGAHYANMMSHSDVAGFGYAVGSNGQAYWVAVYGNNDGGN